MFQQNSIKTIHLPTNDFPNRSFELKNVIGTGSEGQVFLAEPKNWGNNNFQVAIKIQEKLSQKEIELINSIFKAQNSTLGKNENWSENLIKIYHFEIRDNQSITVMELGEQSLYEYLKSQRGKLNQEEKLKICLDVAKSIAFLHEIKMIHRDIKTENFILVKNNIKLIDFGLITKLENQYKTVNIGSKIFMPPEILIENVGWPLGKYDERVDVWAAGCAFYEILTGKDVFVASTPEELQNLTKTHKENPAYVNDKINQLLVEQEFKEIITMMFIYNYEERTTMKDVVEVLQKLYNQQKSAKEQKSQQQPHVELPLNTFQQQSFGANLKGQTLQPKPNQQFLQNSVQSNAGGQFQSGQQQIGQFQGAIAQFQGGQQLAPQFQAGQQLGQQFQVNQHTIQTNSQQQFPSFNNINQQLPFKVNNNFQQIQNQKPLENLNNQSNSQDSTIQFLNRVKQMILQPIPKVQDIVKQIEDFQNEYEQKQKQQPIDQEFEEALQKVRMIFQKKNQ